MIETVQIFFRLLQKLLRLRGFRP